MNENPLAPVPEPVAANVEPIPQHLVLTSAAQRYLSQTAPWIRFFSILMFVASGIMMVVGVMMVLLGFLGGFAASQTMHGAGPFPGGIGIVFLGPFYFLMALLMYIIPAVFLFRYSGSIKMLRTNQSEAALEEAMRHQKSFWRYVGIMTCVMVVLGFVVALGAGFLAAFLASRSG